jgi:hypothetical protein
MTQAIKVDICTKTDGYIATIYVKDLSDLKKIFRNRIILLTKDTEFPVPGEPYILVIRR